MAAKTKKKVAPGDSFKQGVVVRVSDEGAWLGRAAEAGEACPARHTEHTIDGKRVILSDDQGPYPISALE